MSSCVFLVTFSGDQAAAVDPLPFRFVRQRAHQPRYHYAPSINLNVVEAGDCTGTRLQQQAPAPDPHQLTMNDVARPGPAGLPRTMKPCR